MAHDTAPQAHSRTGQDFRAGYWLPSGPTRQEVALGKLGSVGGRAADVIAGDRLRGLLDTFMPPMRAGTTQTPGDPGFLGPDSVMWRVFADASVLAAGPAAVSMQGMHPRAFAGFADYTDINGDPNGRLIRTNQYLMLTTYGDKASAQRAINYAQGMHKRIKGTTPDGRPYDGLEQELQMWVHITTYASIAAAYQRFGKETLTEAELDQYVAETAIIGEKFGLEGPPRTWAELNDAFELFRKLLSLDVRAAKGISFFMDPVTLPTQIRLAFRTVWPASMMCMPPFCRGLLFQPVPSARQLATARVLIRSLDKIVGEPEMLAAAHERIRKAPHDQD